MAARPSFTLAISHYTASWTTVVLLCLTSMIIQPQTLLSSKHAAHYHPIIEDLYSEFYCGPAIKVGDLRSAVIRPSVSLPHAPISIQQYNRKPKAGNLTRQSALPYGRQKWPKRQVVNILTSNYSSAIAEGPRDALSPVSYTHLTLPTILRV